MNTNKPQSRQNIFSSQSHANHEPRHPTFGLVAIQVTLPDVSIYTPVVALDQPIVTNTVQVAGSTVVQTTTDADGNYSLQASPGTYTLYVSNDAIPLANAPSYYTLYIPNYVLSQSVMYDIQLPLKRVHFHVQNSAGTPIENVLLKNNSISVTGLTMNGGITDVYGTSQYGFRSDGIPTDRDGNVDLWVYPTTYTFTAAPPRRRKS